MFTENFLFSGSLRKMQRRMSMRKNYINIKEILLFIVSNSMMQLYGILKQSVLTSIELLEILIRFHFRRDEK